MGVEITRTSQSHPELVSGSHCEPILILHRGQILKRVQDDHQQKKLKAHYSLLTTQSRLEDGERQPSSSKIIGQELYCPLLISTIPHRKLNDINLNGF